VGFEKNYLNQGKKFDWLYLADKGVNVQFYEATFFDPSTKETRSYSGTFMPLPPCSANAIYSSCVKQKFKSMNNSYDKAKLSIATGVLCQQTSLLAYARCMKDLTEVPLLVRIPMIAAD
jgi:hypothetical protein